MLSLLRNAFVLIRRMLRSPCANQSYNIDNRGMKSTPRYELMITENEMQVLERNWIHVLGAMIRTR